MRKKRERAQVKPCEYTVYCHIPTGSQATMKGRKLPKRFNKLQAVVKLYSMHNDLAILPFTAACVKVADEICRGYEMF